MFRYHSKKKTWSLGLIRLYPIPGLTHRSWCPQAGDNSRSYSKFATKCWTKRLWWARSSIHHKNSEPGRTGRYSKLNECPLKDLIQCIKLSKELVLFKMRFARFWIRQLHRALAMCKMWGNEYPSGRYSSRNSLTLPEKREQRLNQYWRGVLSRNCISKFRISVNTFETALHLLIGNTMPRL